MGECQFPPALIQACFILHTGCFSSQFLKVLFEDWQQNTLKLLCSIFWCWQCARWCSSALWSILASYSPCFGFPARNCHPYCKITFSADHVYDEIFNVAALSFSAWFSTLRCDNPVCGLVRFRNKKTFGDVSANCRTTQPKDPGCRQDEGSQPWFLMA